MALIPSNSNRSITTQMQSDGVRLANLAHEAWKFHPRLRHENQDGTVFAPRINWVHFSTEPETGSMRFVVLVVDPEALWTKKLEWFDSQARFLLQKQFDKPVFRLPPETLAALYKLRTDQAANMVAYLVDLIPAKRKLPGKVELPAALTKDYLLIGTDGRRQIGGTAKELQSIMVGGEPGSGKSVLLQSLAFQASQHGWQVYLAEPATAHTWQREIWRRVPGVVAVENTEDGVLRAVGAIQAEVERRSQLFDELSRQRDSVPPVDIFEYNQITGAYLPPILLGIDEYTTFRNSLFADVVEDATKQYRKYGLVTLIASQSWKADDISNSFGALLHTRVCLKVNDPYVGAAVLHRNYRYGREAVGLHNPGRALTFIDGRLTEFQGYYLAGERVTSIMRASVEQPVKVETDGIDWALVKEMVQWAMDERRNGDRGKFSVRGVGAAFRARISAPEFNSLARMLEAREFITKNTSNTGRRITPELLRKVGL
jgi:hypothetical protein